MNIDVNADLHTIMFKYGLKLQLGFKLYLVTDTIHRHLKVRSQIVAE
jgi:hypothetical protein